MYILVQDKAQDKVQDKYPDVSQSTWKVFANFKFFFTRKRLQQH